MNPAGYRGTLLASGRVTNLYEVLEYFALSWIEYPSNVLSAAAGTLEYFSNRCAAKLAKLDFADFQSDEVERIPDYLAGRDQSPY